MTRTREPGEDQPAGTAIELDGTVLGGAGAVDGADHLGGTAERGLWWLDGGADLAAETAELIAQIRQLAAHDPTGVQQVVADVMAALGGADDGGLPPSEGAAIGDSQQDPPPVGEAGSIAAEQV